MNWKENNGKKIEKGISGSNNYLTISDHEMMRNEVKVARSEVQ